MHCTHAKSIILRLPSAGCLGNCFRGSLWTSFRGFWRPPKHFKQVKMHYLNPCHDVLPPSSQFGLGELFPRLLGSLWTSFRGCWRPPDHFKQVEMHYLNPCHDVLPPPSQFGLVEKTLEFWSRGKKNLMNSTLCGSWLQEMLIVIIFLGELTEIGLPTWQGMSVLRLGKSTGRGKLDVLCCRHDHKCYW